VREHDNQSEGFRDLNLESLRERLPVGPAPDCPEAIEWVEFAGGAVTEDRSAGLLRHLAGCTHCARVFQAICSDPAAVAEDEALLGQLAIMQPQTVRSAAARMAATSAVVEMKSRRAPFRWQWAAIAASLVVVAISVWAVLRFGNSSGQAQEMLARAYTAERAFDYRLPDAGYAPVRQQRSGSRSSFDRPKAIVDAEAAVRREMESDPSSFETALLRARAEMLSWQFEAAIVSLTRARELRPNDPAVLTDLACAHAMQGDARACPAEFLQASELLAAALRVDPTNARALFNRAVVLERLALPEEAIRAWNEYLRVETRGGWPDEARRRLSALELKKKSEPPPNRD